MAFLLVASLLNSELPSVEAHASLLWPLPRGGIDRSLPAYSGGKFPEGHYNCECHNASESVCESAQSCLWFENGCTIGCQCSGNGTLSRLANYSACNAPSTGPTNNDPLTRTLNRGAKAGSAEDVYRFMPWRAPGSAITSDPCGIAGGSPIKQGNGGEYNPTQFARQGDRGSGLPSQPHGVVWRAGSEVNTSLFIKANHGGGYYFRLCRADRELTEECFRQTPLPFAGRTQTLRFADGSEQAINATYVSQGTSPPGSVWVMNPVPECCPADGACEKRGFTCGSAESKACYSHQCGADAGLGPSEPAFPWPADNKGAPPTNLSPAFSIVDTLLVPAGLEPGQWVLGWRWDAEETAQVWSACADITIV